MEATAAIPRVRQEGEGGREWFVIGINIIPGARVVGPEPGLDGHVEVAERLDVVREREPASMRASEVDGCFCNCRSAASHALLAPARLRVGWRSRLALQP